jgi:hypothetical protein
MGDMDMGMGSAYVDARVRGRRRGRAPLGRPAADRAEAG